MVDFFVVMMSVIGVCLVAFLIARNDGPGNVRPDKTLLAMNSDPPDSPLGRRRRF